MRCSVGQNRNVNARRQIRLELRQELFDAIDHLNRVRARLTLNVHDHCRRLVHPRGKLGVLHVVNNSRDIRQHHRRAVVVGDDERTVVLAREQLVVGVDLISLLRSVESYLSPD